MKKLMMRCLLPTIMLTACGSDGLGSPNLFDLSNLQKIVLSGHIYSGDLGRASVLANLCPMAGIFNTASACSAIQRWDGAATLSSVGLPVWQEFWNNLLNLSSNYWMKPFDLNDPVNTPSGLYTAPFAVKKALYDAQTKIENANLSFTAPLSEQQHCGVSDPTISIFGAGGGIGAFTIAEDPDLELGQSTLGPDGYRIRFGNSYVQIVTWDSGGVHAEGFLTYSESTDPASPHYADFTQAYSQQRWYRFPFHPSEIAAEQESRITLRGTSTPVGE